MNSNKNNRVRGRKKPDWVELVAPYRHSDAKKSVWLFFVQHQLEETYWEHQEEWGYTLAALQGSPYYKLPKVLQWFTGNIGFHHIHHLSPRKSCEYYDIENYYYYNIGIYYLKSSAWWHLRYENAVVRSAESRL